MTGNLKLWESKTSECHMTENRCQTVTVPDVRCKFVQKLSVPEITESTLRTLFSTTLSSQSSCLLPQVERRQLQRRDVTNIWHQTSVILHPARCQLALQRLLHLVQPQRDKFTECAGFTNSVKQINLCLPTLPTTYPHSKTTTSRQGKLAHSMS